MQQHASPPSDYRAARLDSAGLQMDSLRRRNASTIAEAILRHGAVSRAEISAEVGLSGGAITKITAELRRAGFVVEGQASALERDPGRPRVPIRIDRSTYRFGGVHIGLRRSTVGLVDLAGGVVTQAVAEHRRKDPGAVLREARELLEEAQRQAGGEILGVGICAGGWVEPRSGIVRDHPVLGWQDVSLADAVPWSGVLTSFDSSVRALALAEVRFGAARAVDSALYVFIGNIVGAAHVVRGQIAPGRNAAAGAIDHLPVGRRNGVKCTCGRQDCLWSLASDLAVVERARAAGVVSSRGQLEDVVLRASTAGPKQTAARKLLQERASSVGVAAGLLMDLFAPDVVVLGGGILESPEHLAALRSAASRRSSRHPDAGDLIVASSLGPEPLVRGAATLALDAFYRDPLQPMPGRMTAARA